MKKLLQKCVKKGICIVLTLTLLVCVLPVNAGKAEAATVANNLGWTASCKLKDKSTVEFKTTLIAQPTSDDQKLYLYELNTYDYDLVSGALLVDTKPMTISPVFTFSLNYGQENTRLYKKFVLAVKTGGVMTMIMEPQYITNPEVLATNTRTRFQPTTKKGLMLDGLNGNALGVQNYITNMYAATGQYMTEILDQKGVKNVVVLNKWNPTNMNWINPLSRDNSKANYYMFNAADKIGVDLLAKSFTNYAGAYSYDNWIIGNEINARNPWNYTKLVSVEQYTREYVQAYRVMYTAIRSVNANAQVYISLDQSWNRNKTDENDYYDSRDVLDYFNMMMIQNGNLDYGIAFHPYPVPLYWAKVWDMSTLNPYYAQQINDTIDSPMVTFQNLHVLTDYIQQDAFLDSKGHTRSVILSEIGLNSRQGEDVQAAAMVYAYLVAENNDAVDSIIFSRGYDHTTELKDNMAFGLYHINGTPKMALQVFQTMDTKSSAQALNYAKMVIGIQDWNELIRHYPCR